MFVCCFDVKSAPLFLCAPNDVGTKPQRSSRVFMFFVSFFVRQLQLFIACNAIVDGVYVFVYVWITATKLPANNFVYFYLCGAHTLGTRSSKHIHKQTENLYSFAICFDFSFALALALSLALSLPLISSLTTHMRATLSESKSSIKFLGPV